MSITYTIIDDKSYIKPPVGICICMSTRQFTYLKIVYMSNVNKKCKCIFYYPIKQVFHALQV